MVRQSKVLDFGYSKTFPVILFYTNLWRHDYNEICVFMSLVHLIYLALKCLLYNFYSVLFLINIQEHF